MSISMEVWSNRGGLRSSSDFAELKINFMVATDVAGFVDVDLQFLSVM